MDRKFCYPFAYFPDSNDGYLYFADISLLLAVAVATSSYHGISVGWLFVIAVFIMFLPGIKLAEAGDFKQVNFPFLLFAVACFSIGTVANYLGVGSVIAQLVYPLIKGSFINSLTQVGLPYESAPVLIIFGYGMTTMKSFAKYCTIKAIIGLLCILLIFIPYWMLIGLV